MKFFNNNVGEKKRKHSIAEKKIKEYYKFSPKKKGNSKNFTKEKRDKEKQFF